MEANGLLTSASKNFMLHLIAIPNEFQSRISFHTYGQPLAAADLSVFVAFCSRNALLSDRPDSLGSSWIDSDLDDLLHHVNCVHLLNLQSTFGDAFVVPSVFSRRLHVFRFELCTNPS